MDEASKEKKEAPGETQAAQEERILRVPCPRKTSFLVESLPRFERRDFFFLPVRCCTSTGFSIYSEEPEPTSMTNAQPTVTDRPRTYHFGSLSYDFSLRTHVMGILNVTPDSFADGGRYFDLDAAVLRGVEIEREGADFIDVGGESTRPGSDPVPLEEEVRRVVPVIEELKNRLSIPISVDTWKSAVARRALEGGASIVNDISGFHFDEEMANVVAEYGASAVLMHIKGTPKTMQQNPSYGDVVREVMEYLKKGVEKAQARGVQQIIVDPGIGFGKRFVDNLEILRRIGEFRQLGFPVMVGPSRKSFIGMILDVPVEQRLMGTAAAVATSILNGANLVRVHDVSAMKQLAKVVDAIRMNKSN